MADVVNGSKLNLPPALVAVTDTDGNPAAAMATVLVGANGRILHEEPDVVAVTLVADTSIYADNDVLAIPQEITGFFRDAGGKVSLDSIVLLDEADQAVDVELIFMDANGTLGTINEPVTMSDADARKVLGSVLIVAADYTDLVNGQVATKRLDTPLWLEGVTTSLWLGAIVRSGTPTYAAASLKLKLGIRRF